MKAKLCGFPIFHHHCPGYPLSLFLEGTKGPRPWVGSPLKMLVSKFGISKRPGGPYFQGRTCC